MVCVFHLVCKKTSGLFKGVLLRIITVQFALEDPYGFFNITEYPSDV